MKPRNKNTKKTDNTPNNILDAIKNKQLQAASTLFPDDPNDLLQQDNLGNTALHYAMQHLRGEKGVVDGHYEPQTGYYAIVKHIIEEKPELLTLKNKEGIAPIDIFEDLKQHLNRLTTIESIKSYGSDVTLQDVINQGLENIQRLAPSSTASQHHGNSTAAIMKQTTAAGQPFHFTQQPQPSSTTSQPASNISPGMTQHYDTQIKNILANITIARDAYKKLHPLKGKHTKEFDALLAQMKTLDNSLNKKQQFEAIIDILESQYRNIVGNPQKKESIFSKHNDLINTLCDKKNGHHFTRIICLALNDIYKNEEPLHAKADLETGDEFRRLGKKMFQSVEGSISEKNQKIYAGFSAQQQPEVHPKNPRM